MIRGEKQFQADFTFSGQISGEGVDFFIVRVVSAGLGIAKVLQVLLHSFVVNDVDVDQRVAGVVVQNPWGKKQHVFCSSRSRIMTDQIR